MSDFIDAIIDTFKSVGCTCTRSDFIDNNDLTKVFIYIYNSNLDYIGYIIVSDNLTFTKSLISGFESIMLEFDDFDKVKLLEFFIVKGEFLSGIKLDLK